MTQSKSTKRALIASAASVLISCAMLVGTTFAWFTDSVSSGKNVIQAGNLDVTMEWRDGKEDPTASDGWTDASGSAIFDYDKWEPGYAQVRHIRISNVGNLALKYQINIASTGEVGKLAEAIDVYYVQGGQQIANRSDLNGLTPIGTLKEILAKPYAAKGHLLAEAGSNVDVATIALKMREDAGNEYQNLSIGSEFTIQLVATQYAHESDSFDNQYDQDAAYPVSVDVSDKDSLKDALNHPGVPADITLTETIGSSDDLTVTGDVTLNLGQNRLNQSNMDIVGADISVNNGGSLVINAISPDGWAYNAGKLMADGSGSSLTVNGGKYGDSGYQNAEVSAKNGSVVYLTEGSFSTSGAEGHAVVAESGATVYISGGSYSSSGAKSSVLYAGGGTIIITNYKSVTANGVKFSAANGGKILISKAFLSTKPTSVGTGCTVADDGENWLISANE